MVESVLVLQRFHCGNCFRRFSGPKTVEAELESAHLPMLQAFIYKLLKALPLSPIHLFLVAFASSASAFEAADATCSKDPLIAAVLSLLRSDVLAYSYA